MGDFILDLRPARDRSPARIADSLRFAPWVSSRTISEPQFDLILTSADRSDYWSPSESPDLLVALVGRISLNGTEWAAARALAGNGGWAARWIANEYRAKGVTALGLLNGNFALVLVDRTSRQIHLVSDPAGAFPVFRSEAPGAPVFGSHPDALALAVGEDQDWDETSLSEFAFASIVTPPFTFYKRIMAVDQATITTIFLDEECRCEQRPYFKLEFRADPAASEEDLAEELASTLKEAIRRRSHPSLGRVAVALSGGLDSRSVLAAIQDPAHCFAFCCFDEENMEFGIAERIARELGVNLVPLPRSFDYYADTAEWGVRVSGGMGSFGSNHFLGIAGKLRELGAESLLTGCYCDYLFKGLVLNTRRTRLLGREVLSGYQDQYYFTHFRLNEPELRAVRARWEIRFPEAIRAARNDADIFEMEMRRTFPLWHEGDNMQRLPAQRLLGNSLPFADRNLISLYCRIPYRHKLNRSIFKKTAERICGPLLTRIPDANTGAPVNAGLLRESLSSTGLRIKRKISALKPGIRTDTSWPDWNYYVSHSPKLKELWMRPNAAAEAFLRKCIPASDIRTQPADYRGRDLFLFVQLLSVKLWIAQRTS